jgi:hypothetical protein
MANPNMKRGSPSVNPTGRPTVAVEFRVKARALVDELVLKAWEREVRNGGDNWLKASELLAAYGYGKPNQSIDLTADVTSRDASPPLTNDERRRLLQLQLDGEKAKT